MERRTYQQIALIAFIVLFISTLCVSCHKNNKIQKEKIVVTHEFPNTNWAFEEEVLDFGFDITDTVSAYRIEFVLEYDSAMNELSELPVTITLTGPDGMETFVSSKINFDSSINSGITSFGNNGVCKTTLVAFPKKELKTAGHYNVNFYRKASKADNYGMHQLSLCVVPLKK